MNTELIILIIGTALILLAILGSITSKSSGQGIISFSVRLPVGLIGLFLIIYGGYAYGTVNYQAQIESPVLGNKVQVDYPVKRVQVVSPVAGDSVNCRILTTGVYPNSHELDIWVLLKPTDDKYYPQSDFTNTSYKMNGEWQVLTRFGGDKAEAYDIIVYETDAEASAFFSKTIEDWKAVLSYPGLEEADLPSGAKELERVTVYLQGTCRGVF